MSEEEYDDEIAPLDIQIEILKRLPIKSVLKFMSVSKTWKSIIQSSRFISDYNISHIQPHHLSFVGYNIYYVDIFNDNISNLQRITIPLSDEQPQSDSYKLIGYSQGLFGFHCSDDITPHKDSVVVIWNPSIRKSLFIPVPVLEEPMLNYQTKFDFTVCNATDPTIIKTSFVMTDKFVVSSCRQIEIFRLSTGDWRTLSDASCLPRESLRVREKIVIDRFAHWIAYDRTPEGNLLNNLILSFDIIGEHFTELCLPPTLANTSLVNLDLELSKLRESLLMLEYHKHKVDVWMIMEAGVQNSFTKLYTVKPPCTMSISVFGFRDNGQPIIQCDLRASDNASYKEVLLFYESDLERFNEIDISGYPFPTTLGSYMETLLLLDR